MKKKILLHTQTELDELKKYMLTGDPYRNLNVNKNATNKDIYNSYKVLVRKHKIKCSEKRKQETKPNKSQLEKEKKGLKKLTNSYKLLSNRRMKELYDHYYYDEMIRECEKIDEKNSVSSSFLNNLSFSSSSSSSSSSSTSLLLKDLSHLLMNITYYPIREYVYFIQSSVNINGGFDEIVFNFKELPKYGLGKLYKGLFLSSFCLNQLDHFRSTLLGKVAGGIFGLKPQSLIGRVIKLISKSIVLLPFCLITDVYVLAPNDYSLFRVIRDCILKRGGDGSIKLGNLYHSFFPILSIMIAKKLIRGSSELLKDIINKKYENNKDSKTLSLLNSLFSNFGLISSLLCCPLQVIYIQYPKLIINSFLENNSSPIPTINPISIAIEIYKNNNNTLNRFFCGLFPYILSNAYLNYITSTNDYDNNKKSTYNYFDLFS
ncbi:hypothetical protein RB653_000628 [Dictyostelium firmibasis]|uniref:J domain-containing protein n=1 Tax=Dictyostelium firmibasis TaxID=79012 RepID=A0AAN7YUH2_9MYCE